MKIITENGEYVFYYEDDAIIYADPPKVQVTLVNTGEAEAGKRVQLEVEFYELESMAEFLCKHQKCGICGKTLWHRDNRCWHHEVGNICRPCEETSDHPAAQQHRSFKKMVEDRIEERKNKA